MGRICFFFLKIYPKIKLETDYLPKTSLVLFPGLLREKKVRSTRLWKFIWPPPNGVAKNEPKNNLLNIFASLHPNLTLMPYFFQDLFEVLFPAKILEIQFVCFSGKVTIFKWRQRDFGENWPPLWWVNRQTKFQNALTIRKFIKILKKLGYSRPKRIKTYFSNSIWIYSIFGKTSKNFDCFWIFWIFGPNVL